MKIFIILSAAVLLAQGAPAVDNQVSRNDNPLFDIFARLCVTMLPEHSDRPRQPEPFPVTIVKTPDLPTYTRGQSILVTLRGRPGFNFTGFLIQARAIGSTIPVGTWTAGATAIVVGCHPDVLNVNDFPDGNDTGAHQTGSLRNIQEMVWTAPNTPGTYRFELTTVEVFGVYWMNQFSSTFTVV